MKSLMLSLAGLLLLTTGLQAEDEKPKQKPKAKPKPRVIQLRVGPAAAGPVVRIRTGSYGGPAKLYLLRRPDVAKDLKLDADQKEEVTEAIQEITRNRRDEYQKLRTLPIKDRVKKSRELSKKFTEMGNKKAKDILNEKQITRLDQIALQMQGIRALRNPEIVKKLKITKEQTKKFQDVQSEITKQRAQLYKDLRAGKIARAKLREKTQALTKSLEKKTLDVLNKDQRAKFETMKGKTFETTRRAIGLRAAPAAAGRIRLRKINARKIKVKAKPVRPKGEEK